MHIFLTGAIQIGKTTVLDKTLALLGVTAGGFRTYFGADRRSAHHYLYMSSAAEPRVFTPEHAIVEFGKDADGKLRRTVLPRFAELGLQYLAAAPAYPLIVLDECGRLEQQLHCFHVQVLALLEGDTPILGVVRQDAMGWLEEIRRHPNVRLITVTEENRDDLPRQLAEYYRPLLNGKP